MGHGELVYLEQAAGAGRGASLATSGPAHPRWDGSLNFKGKVYLMQSRHHWLLLSHNSLLSEREWRNGERGTSQSWLSCDL